MIDLILDTVIEQVQRALKLALQPIAPYLRKLGGGLVVLLLSTFLWALSLFALAVSLFCKLANLLVYVAPALYVCLAAALCGLLLVGIGSNLLRRPR